jgi:hypothetical protein
MRRFLSTVMRRSSRLALVATGVAVALSSAGIVRAEHTEPDGSCKSSGYCAVYDDTGGGGGIEGASNDGTGIYGQTGGNGNSGISGINTGKGNGLYGRSSVWGGINGGSVVGAGVIGNMGGTTSGNGYGVRAEATNSSSSYQALLAQATGSTTTIFYGHNVTTGANCAINYDAVMTCTGSVTGSVLRNSIKSATGRSVAAYTRQQARATIEEVGTSALAGGVARVTFDPTFVTTIDASAPYHVFITPLGDTAGLYVAATSSRGFTVLEAQGRRSTVSFDYRVVAQPRDGK